MSILILDLLLADRFKAERENEDASRYDEIWDGTYVMSPPPNNVHQRLGSGLWKILEAVIEGAGMGIVFNVCNVSDREEGWTHNYRVPDVAVFLNGTTAKDCDTHWCGGPDFAVEILSPNDLAREKRPFYAKVGVRELLIVDRQPWALELYRLEDGALNLVGTTTLEHPQALASAVLPLTFALVDGEKRPMIEVVRADGTQRWTV